MKFTNLLKPAAYRRRMMRAIAVGSRNWKSVVTHEPGHFYSPHLDLEGLDPAAERLPSDDETLWECANLDETLIRSTYQDLMGVWPSPDLPDAPVTGSRYHQRNGFFSWGDAFVLSALIRRDKPANIVEVGSGFSSAVILDTLNQTGLKSNVTLVDPYPQRLQSLLMPEDLDRVSILESNVQDVPIDVFDQLTAGDICFIDSSHVAKVGSDVTYLFLKVLPKLRSGVLIHVHDVFYNASYPMPWIQEGHAWNESIILRAFLTGNTRVEVIAFNDYAASVCPDLFLGRHADFATRPGSGFWMRSL
jgi:hypothetical protein